MKNKKIDPHQVLDLHSASRSLAFRRRAGLGRAEALDFTAASLAKRQRFENLVAAVLEQVDGIPPLLAFSVLGTAQGKVEARILAGVAEPEARAEVVGAGNVAKVREAAER